MNNPSLRMPIFFPALNIEFLLITIFFVNVNLILMHFLRNIALEIIWLLNTEARMICSSRI